MGRFNRVRLAPEEYGGQDRPTQAHSNAGNDHFSHHIIILNGRQTDALLNHK
jgi:hypothetical protein